MAIEDVIPNVELNQVSGQKKFTATITATTDEQAQALAKAQAQQQAYSLYGNNTQFTSFDQIYVKVDTAPDGNGFLYTATYTTTAVDVPVTVTTPLTETEQNNLKPVAENTEPAESTNTTTYYENDGTASTTNSTVYYENNGVGSTSDSTQLTGVVVGTTQNSVGPVVTSGQQVYENPLHDYESYSYGLSLHLMDINYFNSLLENPDQGYVPQNVLISSAGRWGSTFPRDPNFTEDFFFEDLKIKTYISPTVRNRNTNLISCSFTIIEPLGFTLINRLLAAVTRLNGNFGNYLKMPYMLQIDFFGTTDNNISNTALTTGPIKGMTKHLPILITSLKSKLTAKGTEYQVEASPYNHTAYNRLNVSNPAACSISGTTVQEIFGSGIADTNYSSKLSTKNSLDKERSEITAFIQEYRAAGGQEGSPQDYYNAQTRLSQINQRLENEFATISAKGYTDAINGWFQKLKDTKQIKEVNSITVKFDPIIGSKALYPSGLVNVAQVPTSGTSEKDKKTSVQNAAGLNKGQITFNGSVITVPAGMSIDKLIDWAVRNSEYIGGQLSIDPNLRAKIQAGASTESFGQSLNWYKIVPKIKIKNYDINTNNYSVDITFFVKPYKLATTYPFAPQGRVPGFVKRYDYIFTGKNKDVIDCQLDFDTLYYIPVTAAKDKEGWAKTGGPINQPGFNPDADETTPRPQSFAAHPVQLGFISGSVETTDRSGAGTAASVAAGDLQRAITLSARGDMITVNLRILGDPHFIKQDDVFYGQNLAGSQNQFINNNIGSSLWMDNGELYVFLNFLSPVDYDETTGLANPATSKFRLSEMSGVYKVITVDNVFARGKFEQTLMLVKLLYDQEGKPLQNVLTDRSETVTAQSLGPLVANEFVRFVGPRVNLASVAATNTTAALLATAASGGGSSLLSSLVQQGVQTVTNQVIGKINQQVGQVVGKAVTDIGNQLKSIIDPTFGINAPGGANFGADIGFDNYDSVGYEAITGDAGTVLQDSASDLFPPGSFDSLETGEFAEAFDTAGFEDLGFEDLGLDVDIGDWWS